MTRHKHADLIIAWAEGAEIQIKQWSDWAECKDPAWVYDNEYRIKPVPPQPEYVPFTWEDRELLRGKWVKSKSIDDPNEYLIQAITRQSVFLLGTAVPFGLLLKAYTFLDGTPCGKLKI